MAAKTGVFKISFIVIAAIAGASVIYFVLAASLGESKIIGVARWDDSADYSLNIQGFKDGLQRMGFVEGKNVSYLIESAHADKDKQKGIIEQHGGRIWFDKTYSNGAAIKFTLPHNQLA